MAGRKTEIGDVFAANPDNAAKMIKKAARDHGGHRLRMAEELDISRTTLFLTIQSLDAHYGHSVNDFVNACAERAEEKEEAAKNKQLNKEVRKFLKEAGGHIKYAAELANVSQNSFYKWMRKLEAADYEIRSYAASCRRKREQHRLYE